MENHVSHLPWKNAKVPSPPLAPPVPSPPHSPQEYDANKTLSRQ